MENNKICPKCQNTGLDNFCSKCGSLMNEMRVIKKCPQCNEVSDDARFCPRCGIATQEEVVTNTITEKTKRKGKPLLVVVAAAVCILAVTISVHFFKGSGDELPPDNSMQNIIEDNQATEALTADIVVTATPTQTPTPSPAVTLEVDTMSSASPKESKDPQALLNGLSENGFWIFALLGDVTLTETLNVDGVFYNRDNTEDVFFRKLALNTLDESYTVTDRFTLTVPEMRVTSPNFLIQHGTIRGDVYVNAEGFCLRGVDIEGTLTFETQAQHDSADLWNAGSISGGVLVGSTSVDSTEVYESITEPTSNPISDFEYRITDNEAVITKYRGNDNEVIIPSNIDGCIVTTIGAGAFNARHNLTSVTIPFSVQSINDGAFASCDNLTSVTISSGVITIGNKAFRNCRSLTSVELPYSVTTIGYQAFISCDNLTSVTIRNNFTAIGAGAFAACRSLTSVTIPNGITTIAANTFSNCESLTNVTIPDSVTNINFGAFEGCALTNLILPNSVTTIGDMAFRNCDNLVSVTIPSSVTTIGDQAFFKCDNLISAYFEGDAPNTPFGYDIFSSHEGFKIFYKANTSGWKEKWYNFSIEQY